MGINKMNILYLI